MINGSVEPGFGLVADAFRANFESGAETGAACVVYADGKRVVDLYGGIADRARGIAWTGDTVVVGFSVTKGLMALCAYLAHQCGLLDFDAPVVSVWPEFGAHGKGDITIRQLFAHRAGLMALDTDLTFEQVLAWDPVIRAIEDQTPLWTPGTAYAYHALTYGWLAGEVLRRVTGLMPGELVAQYLADPLHADVWIGVPPDVDGRIATLYSAKSAAYRSFWRLLPYALRASGRTSSVRAITLGGAFPFSFFDGGQHDFNGAASRRAQIPAANGILSARALAKIYAAAVSEVDGMPALLSLDSIADATTVRSAGDGWDRGVNVAGSRFSTGFMLDGLPNQPMLSETSFGHDGASGSLGFADAERRIGFGYLTNQFGARTDVRSRRLNAALRRSLG